MDMALDLVAGIGRATLSLLRATGAITLFALSGLSHIVRPPFYGRVFWGSFLETGFFSLPVVALNARFSGGVIGWQSYTGFAQYHAQSAMAGIGVLAGIWGRGAGVGDGDAG